MKSGKNNKKVLQKLNHWLWRRNSRADVIWWSNHQIKHHHVFNILHFIVCVCEVKPFFPFTLSNHYYAMRDVTKNSVCCLQIYIFFITIWEISFCLKCFPTFFLVFVISKWYLLSVPLEPESAVPVHNPDICLFTPPGCLMPPGSPGWLLF